MKKLVLLMTALLACAISLSAQTSQVATLSHDGQITTYYSANALKDAYAAAVEGDIITLSSGQFYGCDMNKKDNITVRGAGMMPDNDPTIIVNDIRLGNSRINDWTFEGILFTGDVYFDNGTNVRFVKCYFAKYFVEANTINTTILHCIAINYDSRNSTNTSRTIIDSYLNAQKASIYNTSLTNCVVYINNVGNVSKSVLKNCIITDDSTNNKTYLPSSTTASYTYYVGKSQEDVFTYSPSTTNVSKSDISVDDIFENLNTYELKENYAQSWLGDDETQVGMHGGFIPFDPTPTNPQITKFNVAKKTTADGLLSVDIEVKAN